MRRFLLAVFFALLPVTAYCAKGIPLTLVLVQEQEVCAGGNYLKDGSCSSVSFDQVQRWLNTPRKHPRLSTTLEPGSHAVLLPPAFFAKFRLLVDYDGFPPPDTDLRWSIVLLFKIPGSSGQIAILKRFRTKGIEETTTRMHVGEGGHALTHQRADAFRPIRGVAWQLNVGADEYKFWMKKP